MEKNKTAVLQEIGKRIRDLRLAKGISQAELAFQIGVGGQHLSDVELGKKTMRLDTFIKLIEALQVSADSILRPNVPAESNYNFTELSKTLADCSSDELAAILKIVKELKTAMRKNNND